nr:interleukin 1 receptor like 1 [Myotis myotis]
MHNENGVNYNVTATRAFAFHHDESFSLFPEIIAPLQNETRDVEVGRAADITCSACFGKGSQILTVVVWQVNGTNVRNFSEARIWQEQEQNQRYFHSEAETPPWPPTQRRPANSLGGNSGLSVPAAR